MYRFNQNCPCWLNCISHLAMLFYWIVCQKKIVWSIETSVNSISRLSVDKCLGPLLPTLHCQALSFAVCLLRSLSWFSNFHFHATALLHFLHISFSHLLTIHLHRVSKVQPIYQSSTVVVHLYNACFFDAWEMGWESWQYSWSYWWICFSPH